MNIFKIECKGTMKNVLLKGQIKKRTSRDEGTEKGSLLERSY